MGPCLCGDYCCPSCGPAQGNSRCPLCYRWMSEGCEHISVRTGNLKKKFRKEADDAVRREREAEDRMCAEWEKEAALAEGYFRERNGEDLDYDPS